jgi:hypothetical protein
MKKVGNRFRFLVDIRIERTSEKRSAWKLLLAAALMAARIYLRLYGHH